MRTQLIQVCLILIGLFVLDPIQAQYSDNCAEGQFTLQNVKLNATNVEFDIYFASATPVTDTCHEIHLATGDVVINFDTSLFSNISFTKTGGSNIPGYAFALLFDPIFTADIYQPGRNHVSAFLATVVQGFTPVINGTPALLGSFRIDGYNGSGNPQFVLDCSQVSPPPGGGPLTNDPFITQFFTYNTSNITPNSFLYQVDVCTTPNPCFYDTIPPDILCPPDITISCADDTSPLTTGFPSAADVCDSSPTTIGQDTVTTNSSCIQIIERTFFAIDANFNSASCMQLITALDTTPPVFVVCQDITVDTSCVNDSAFVHVPVPLVSDYCNTVVQLTNDYNGTSDASDDYPEGTTAVLWTAIDDCGNVATCTQSVTLNCDSCSTGPNTVTVSEDLLVTGNLLVLGNKCFRIPHPLDPENKLLAHSCVESPVRLNIYSGVVLTDRKGLATVQLPEYFTTLNKNYRYQLTTIGSSMKPAVIWQEINADGLFIIKSKKKHVKISWEVSGERDDTFARKHPFEVEILRE